MTLAELQSVLVGVGIDDVLIAGFVDSSERPLRFYALYRAIFFDFGGILLRFGVLGDTGRMKITRVDAVSPEGLDDDLEPASTSIGQAVLDDPDGANRLRALHLWDIGDCADGIDCAAARFDLSNGQKVFLDPTYHFGIRLGGIQQESLWQESATQKGLTRRDFDL